jgi:hypothetical protein
MDRPTESKNNRRIKMEMFYHKKLNEVQGRATSCWNLKEVSSLEPLDAELDIDSAWETIMVLGEVGWDDVD